MRRDIYSYNRYDDDLARKKRRNFFIKLFLGVTGILLVVGLSVYFLFFSYWLKVTDIRIIGNKNINSEALNKLADSVANKSLLDLAGLKLKSNLLFLDTELLRSEIIANFSAIKEATISKNLPHVLAISITEREPLGVWCFISGCKYFDDSGVLWGEALQSSGPIFLNIDDQRIVDQNTNRVDKKIFDPIKKVISGLSNLGIKIKRVEIPEWKISDFSIYAVSGYKLLFNGDSDISGQIEVLRIFLDQKGKDFKSQYIDLRIDGRVYYK